MRIAIVIPAFKREFLSATLESIAIQDSSDFTVYIGDDASPDDIASVIEPFRKRMDIVYKRFGDNIGSKALTMHWERCIEMVEEEWIYFFSDDDLMPPDAVSRLQEAIDRNKGKHLFRFQLCRINEKNDVIHSNPPFTSSETVPEDILIPYFNGRQSSAAIEYAFNRKFFIDNGGFVNFPVAWCSDVATWYKLAAANGGVINIHGLPAMWRNAPGKNISNTSGMVSQKAAALSCFIGWLDIHFKGSRSRLFRKSLARFIKTNLRVSFGRQYSNKDLLQILRQYYTFDKMRALILALRFCKM